MKKPRAEPGARLERLREEAARCRDCPLWEHATQTVFGEGSARAKLMLVGEQPGDSEDREGRPFIGPAGRILDQALRDAGIDRADTYITNAVKHFKWEPRGKRRLHKTPAQREIDQPSYLLPLKDRPGGEEAYAQFVADLRVAAARVVPDKSDR